MTSLDRVRVTLCAGLVLAAIASGGRAWAQYPPTTQQVPSEPQGAPEPQVPPMQPAPPMQSLPPAQWTPPVQPVVPVEQVRQVPAELAPPRVERWQIAAGFRTSLFRSAGYDPFATDDSFTQFSATATWALLRRPVFTTAVGVAWDAGGVDGQARGSDTSLSLNRLGGLVEERWAPWPWVFAFARVSPAWLHGSAEVTDAAIAAPLRTTFSTFSLDASLGAAVRVGPRTGQVGVWLLAAGGYGWAPNQRIALSPALPEGDGSKAGVTTFADFAPRGAFFSGAVALGF